MSYLTYKILTDPLTFETFVRAFAVPECDDEMPLGKRDMTDEEVQAKWTNEEFIAELSKYGYGYAAKTYVSERSLKHLMNLVNKVTSYHRHGNPMPRKLLDDLSNAQIEYEQARDIK